MNRLEGTGEFFSILETQLYILILLNKDIKITSRKSSASSQDRETGIALSSCLKQLKTEQSIFNTQYSSHWIQGNEEQ